jgi:hypothetical protein
MDTIDFVTEEYAKLLLRFHGAYRHYAQVIILEDAQATGANLSSALLQVSRTHQIDLLLLVHGHEGQLIGYKAREIVDNRTFGPLLDAARQDPACIDIRMVYGVNCYGVTLAETWLGLGAEAVNGAVGVNWFPEPSLSVFLRNWLGGKPFSKAVTEANTRANRVWGLILRPDKSGRVHPWIASSRQVIYGRRDITLHSGLTDRQPGAMAADAGAVESRSQ